MNELLNQDKIDWDLVSKLKDLIAIQCHPENLTDDYHRGLANGLIVALSLVDGKEPVFMEPTSGE